MRGVAVGPADQGVGGPFAVSPRERKGQMKIGTKNWNESLSDIFWEVAALFGMLATCGAVALGLQMARWFGKP